MPLTYATFLTRRHRQQMVQAVLPLLVKRLKFNEHHAPAGSSEGGQFTSGEGGGDPDYVTSDDYSFSGPIERDAREFQNSVYHHIMAETGARMMDDATPAQVLAVMSKNTSTLPVTVKMKANRELYLQSVRFAAMRIQEQGLALPDSIVVRSERFLQSFGEGARAAYNIESKTGYVIMSTQFLSRAAEPGHAITVATLVAHEMKHLSQNAMRQARQPKSYPSRLKFNPNHDELGRFAESDGGAQTYPAFTLKRQKAGDGIAYKIMVEGVMAGHISGFPDINDTFHIYKTEINDAHKELRGTGLYRAAVQQVADQYTGGAFVFEWESSAALQASLRKMPSYYYDEEKRALRIRPQPTTGKQLKDFDESLHPRDEAGKFTDAGARASFTSEQGYQWHEQGPVADWARGLSSADRSHLSGYYSMGYSRINAELRGLYTPPIVEQFVREATPEEIARVEDRHTFVLGNFTEEDRVADGYIVHNVFYIHEGQLVPWSIQQRVPDLAAQADLRERAAALDNLIEHRGHVLSDSLTLSRGAYLPGVSFEDLQAKVGATYTEKGFTSTMLGDAEGRLNYYAAQGKWESLYNRYHDIAAHEDEVGSAMRVSILVPQGTRVASVEAVRRTDFHDELANPRTRSESEVLLGSGAQYRIDRVERGPIYRGGDDSLKPVPIIDVTMTYLGRH